MQKLVWQVKGCVFLSMLFVSCQSFNKEANHLRSGQNKKSVVARKMWIRETFFKNFTRPSVLQSIKPVFASSGLLVQGNRVNGLSAYTLEQGKRKWFFSVKGGLAGDVLVESDFVFFGGADGFMYALYLSTGRVLWKYYVGAVNISRPTIRDNHLYFASANRMYCLKAKTGESVWTYTASLSPSEFTIEGVASPLVNKAKSSLIYFKTSDGSLIALNSRGKLKWKQKLSQSSDRFTSAVSDPVMGKMCLYSAGVESGLYCLNKKTGKVIWKNSSGSHGNLLLSGSRIFYSTSDGKILALDQRSGKQIWSHQVEETIATSPVLYKDILIYGEYSGALRFISRDTGKALGYFSFGSGMSAPPLVSAVNSELYFLSNVGWLYKLKLLL